MYDGERQARLEIDGPAEAPATGGASERAADDFKIVTIRLRSAEHEDFCEQVKALGLTRNLAFRIAARRIAGFIEVDDKTRGDLEGAIAAIGDISENIRALHGAYSAGGVVDADELARQRAAFGHEFASLDASLRSILNVSLRRSDGRQRLEDAMR